MDRWIVGELMLFVRETMPGDDPGTLSTQDYTDIVAYLLVTNGVATGSELTPESTETLVIERPE